MEDYGSRSWGEYLMDHFREVLPRVRPILAVSRSVTDFQERARNEPALEPLVNDAIANLLYTFGLGEDLPQIWCLTPSAYQALSQTDTPSRLLDTLPKLPGRTLYLTFPKGASICVPDADGGSIDVTSILLAEEVEGRLWRYIGFDDKVAAYTVIAFGHLDLYAGPLRQQLSETYDPQGHGAVWRVILNLALALRHPSYLGMRKVSPAVPRAGHKKAKFLRKRRAKPYTVVDLTAPQRPNMGRTSTSQRKPVRRHLVRGHWRRLNVAEPRWDAIIEGSTIVDGERRFQVLLWILPHWRGVEDFQPAIYKVVAPHWSSRHES